MNRIFHILQIIYVVSLGCVAAEVDFNRDVRPILSDHCFYCHGPDEETQEADLRIDIREHALADLGGYAAIVPGKPEESELYLRITDADDLMPPDKAKKILSPQEKKILHDWIAEGAHYDEHWAFQPLAKGEPKESAFAIDQFVLARLDEAGIEPSPLADRETLIRRVYLDVVGVLPTPEEVKDFVSDARPDAWERLVDGLLASRHYGERWGRHWLDQARYADSHGYAIDNERSMWPYRDWVIRAFNEDLPFDQFTIEQIAGDLLESPTKSQLIATAFHRNTMVNQEGGSDPEQFRVEAVLDRVNTTGAVWLGLTVGCAQCHTHKFDQITQREYFELSAFFNLGTDQNDMGKTIPVVEGEVFWTEGQRKSADLVEAKRRKVRAEWEAAEIARLRNRFPEGAEGFVNPSWSTLIPSSAETTSGSALEILEDGALLLGEGHAPNDTLQVKGKTELDGIQTIRLRVLPHMSLPKTGPGTAGNGNFVLTEFQVLVNGEPQKIASVFADHEQDGYPVAGVLDGDPESGWAINESRARPGARLNASHEAVFTLAEPLGVKGGEIEVRFLHEVNKNYLIGHFAIDLSADLAPGPESEIFTALESPLNRRDAEAKRLLDDRFYEAHPEAKPRPVTRGNLMVMEDQADPRETYLLTRGDFTRPDKDGGQLFPGGLSAVAPHFPAAEGQNRLDLAKWLVHPENPLTPRVTMNRMWMRYFGMGLVETEEDFGTQGAQPSHPALLDWLAAEFIRSGWSMKHMHRLIVMSETYQRASRHRADLMKVDARNILLARQNRVRLDAEIVRDAALSASGLLTPKIGGPSVYPPQPEGVYSFTQTSKRWPTAKGADRYRRGIYTMFYRSAPHPLFGTFDAPDFSVSCTRRGRSNTPLQALTVANDPVFVEFAQGMAERLLEEGKDWDARIDRAFRLAIGRAPSGRELEALRAYASDQYTDFLNHPEAAQALLNVRLRAHDDAEEAATLVCIARVVLNTDNFITRE